MTETTNGESCCRIRLLGGAALLDQTGRPVVGPAAQRQRLAVLAVLARAGRAGVTRDRLLGLLWPETPERNARASLASALYALRRVLGESTIVAAGDGMWLDARRLPSDVDAFDAALAAGRPAEAVAVYGGPFLDGFHTRSDAFERWSTLERTALHGSWIAGLEALARAAGEGTDAAEAAVWTRRLVEAEPTSSRFAQMHIHALCSMGDDAAARRCTDVHADAVRTELGAEPDPSVMATLQVASSAMPRVVPSAGDRPPDTVDGQIAGAGSHAEPTAPSRRARFAASAALVTVSALSFLHAAEPGAEVQLLANSVLVVPFVPAGMTASDELGHAIADASTRLLATDPDLRVLDPLALDGHRDPLAVARRAGARWLVTGTWWSRSDSLLASASIIDAATGRVAAGLTPSAVAGPDSIALIESVAEQVAAATAMTNGVPDAVRWAAFTLPKRAEALQWFRTGLATAGRGDPKLATHYLERAATVDPEFASASINLAVELLNAGNPDRARSVAHTTRESGRLSPVERHLLDWLTHFLDGDLDGAARAAFAAHARAPEAPELRVVAGQAALMTGKVTEAVRLLSSIDTNTGSPADDVGYWNDLTTALHLAGDHQREREAAEAAEQRFPDLVLPALFTMRSFVAAGQTDRALSKLAELRGRRGEPGRAPARIALEISELLAARGDDDAARVAATEGLESGNFTAAMDQRVVRANLLHRAGHGSAALDSLLTLLELDPTATSVQGLAGVVATLLQRDELASRLSAMLHASADRASATYWRARMAAARGDRMESERLLAEARRSGMPYGLRVRYVPD